MTKITFFILLFLAFNGYTQEPNDCVDGVITCGNSNVKLDVEGVGNQELTGSNTCSSQENNSIWLKVTVATGGTLGFTLTPNSTSIDEDYDFFIFGPNVSCGNIGNAIRCSTTQPRAAGQGNNLTGMKDVADDEVSEGPGPDGDSFVEWLTVQANESYFFVIDRPAGNSPFTLEWTGTATFYESPNDESPTGVDLAYENCDLNNNSKAFFDLTQDEIQVVGSQLVNVTYHQTISDAQTGVNTIVSPSNFESETATRYMRLTNPVTGCFSVFDIDLEVFTYINIPQLDDYDICEVDNNGIEQFDFSENDLLVSQLAENYDVSYYLSKAEAEQSINEIYYPYENTSNPQIIWMRFDDLDKGCFGFSSFSIQAIATPAINANFSEWVVCDTDTDGVENGEDNDGFYTFDFTVSYLLDNLLNGQDEADMNISFYHSLVDAEEKILPLVLLYTNKQAFQEEEIFVRMESTILEECYNTTSFKIQVIENPVFDVVEETKYICVNLLLQTIDFEIENIQGNYSFSWKNSNGDEISTNSVLSITEAGDYTVTATTTDGNNCETTKIVHLLPAEPANSIQFTMNEYWHHDNFSVDVSVVGAGVYQFALDHIDGPYQESPLLTNIKPGIHTIYVKEMNDCGVSSKIIEVFGFAPYFTPNGDYINDLWKVQGINFKANAKVSIFDRYGKLLFQFKPALNQGWDGMYNGQQMPKGDYWFTAEMINHKGDQIIRKGHFSLIKN